MCIAQQKYTGYGRLPSRAKYIVTRWDVSPITTVAVRATDYQDAILEALLGIPVKDRLLTEGAVVSVQGPIVEQNIVAFKVVLGELVHIDPVERVWRGPGR